MKLAKTHDYCANNNPTLTVAMIHGIASDSSTYDSALQYLENLDALQAVRFVTFDLLGSGQSPKDDKLNYDYNDQVSALDTAIRDLKVTTPLVLVGHSLGTFITTKYAVDHSGEVSQLVLISPPIFRPEDFDNPALMQGIEGFRQVLGSRNPGILTEKSFINSMDKIVLNRDNYRTLVSVKVPTVLIYGDGDQLIASFNIPGVLKQNSMISAIKTEGRHGVTQDKYEKLAKILEEIISA